VRAGLVAGAQDIVLSFNGLVLVSFGWNCAVICERRASGGSPGHRAELQRMGHDHQ
jgi:hypothetical protein